MTTPSTRASGTLCPRRASRPRSDAQDVALAAHLEAREDDDRGHERQNVRAAEHDRDREHDLVDRVEPRDEALAVARDVDDVVEQRDDAGDGGQRDADLRPGQRGQQQPAHAEAHELVGRRRGGLAEREANARGLLMRDRRQHDLVGGVRTRHLHAQLDDAEQPLQHPGRGVDRLHASARDELLVGREDAGAVMQRDVVDPIRGSAPARVADRRCAGDAGERQRDRGSRPAAAEDRDEHDAADELQRRTQRLDDDRRRMQPLRQLKGHRACAAARGSGRARRRPRPVAAPGSSCRRRPCGRAAGRDRRARSSPYARRRRAGCA